MNDRFRVVNDFIGFGNPHGPFWFIGLEEAGGFNELTADQDIKRYEQRILWDEPGPKDKTPVYDIISKILLMMKEEPWQRWAEYRDNQLFTKHGETFQANLFPLGKRSWNYWPTDGSYERLFKFSSRGQYLRYVRSSDRFNMLHKEWSNNQPRVTICFGSSEWATFKTTLRLDTAPERDSWYQTYPGQKVILCPFFSSRPNCLGSNEDRIMVLAKEAKRLLSRQR